MSYSTILIELKTIRFINLFLFIKRSKIKAYKMNKRGMTIQEIGIIILVLFVLTVLAIAVVPLILNHGGDVWAGAHNFLRTGKFA